MAGTLFGWVTLCGQANYFGMQPATKVNSAFHPSRVGKSSIGLSGWVKAGAFTCVGWQVTLSDSIWQVSLYGYKMSFP